MKTFIKSYLTHQPTGHGVTHGQNEGLCRVMPYGTANKNWLGVDLMKQNFCSSEDGTNRLINKFQPNI
jgi:hypothetical protein